MSYNEGITVNGKHSFTDFGLNISSRKIDLPPKNNVRKTIPYMSGFYDFTTLNGVATFGERQISYTFDIIGNTVEEMDRKRTEVVNWFCNMHDVDIYDDTIPDYHFHGSFDSVSQNEDGEKTELTITFVCHPFMIANEPVQMIYNEARTDTIVYEGQPVSIYGKGNATLKMGGSTITINSDEMIDTGLVLVAGEKQIEVVPTELMPYPYTDSSKELNGITWVDNGDRSITAIGVTMGDYSSFACVKEMRLNKGRYRIKGVTNSQGTAIVVNKSKEQDGEEIRIIAVFDDSEGYFDLNEDTDVNISVLVNKNEQANSVVFNPSLIKVTTLEYVEEVL